MAENRLFSTFFGFSFVCSSKSAYLCNLKNKSKQHDNG